MKRAQQQSSRVPSPTPTTFSGISNYRTDSYRPINKSSQPAVPSLDPRIIARTHLDELSRYLAAYLARGKLRPILNATSFTQVSNAIAPANSRSTARQKLTKLTKQQFQELSTDVYDELIRRKKNSSENEGLLTYLLIPLYVLI
jgi:protein SPA2